MKAIVRRSVSAVTFIALLNLSFHLPQQRHLERFADLLVVAPRRKTLEQLADLESHGVDASNLADFFRISPWKAKKLREELLKFLVKYLLAFDLDPQTPIYLSIDDSLTIKDKATRKLQSVDWHFDHNQHRTVRAGNHVVLRIHWGQYHFPLSWRLYLRQSSVRRLNRRRDQHSKLRYYSKLQLTQQMLQEVVSLLASHKAVYVLFDSWYTSAKLVRWVVQNQWHVIAALKSNRKVSGRKLTQWHQSFKGHPYDRVSLGLANGKSRTYWVRTLTGRIRGVPGEVRILLSQKGRGACVAPKYFLCTDTQLSNAEILRRYQHRWSQEVDYWFVKLQLGLGDFRLQSYEAIEKWYAVVYLVLAYLYWCRYEQAKNKGSPPSLSEVMAKIRQEHQREVLSAACHEVAQGIPVAEVLKRYLGSGTSQAA